MARHGLSATGVLTLLTLVFALGSMMYYHTHHTIIHMAEEGSKRGNIKNAT